MMAARVSPSSVLEKDPITDSQVICCDEYPALRFDVVPPRVLPLPL